MSQPQLRAELLAMEAEDQRYRQPGNMDDRMADQMNARHVVRLKQIVDKHGWPGWSKVGEDGSRAAWLITQHADADRAFQRRMLTLIEPLVAVGEVSVETFAYLYDRLHTPQRYGTQGTCRSTGSWVPFEIEDESSVDERRAKAGMVPLTVYAAMVEKHICMGVRKK